ncbi:YdiU family protein [Alphaproteobacteria bacterium]|nr:YdiU family protein [Alphaproteobacteria bacterium]
MKNQPKPVNTHFNLGEDFFDIATQAQFPNHKLRFRNNRSAEIISLDKLTDQEWINYFGKFYRYPGVVHAPLALKYHGHQFGHYNPDLGDGRGFLLAQFLDNNETLWDLGTKGSGQTNFSRGGDGRLTLKGAVRELLATEFLSALGVPTSQTISIIETGENLQRNDEPSPTRSAVLVRRSNGHVRIGTFQRLAYFNEKENIEKLIRHVAKNYFFLSEQNVSASIVAEDFFLESVKKIATSMGRIIVSGFVHGVLNTDNFNVTGETFDYGPWRFIEYANPNFTAAYFDYNRRYSFGSQPEAALWALTQLGKSLKKFISEEKMTEILSQFSKSFHLSLKKHFCWRLGIQDIDPNDLNKTMQILLNESDKNKIDYASVFYDFYGGRDSIIDCLKSTYGSKYKVDEFALITDILKNSVSLNTSIEKKHQLDNSRENLLINEVEKIWEQISTHDNWDLLEDKIKKLRGLGNILGSEKFVNF